MPHNASRRGAADMGMILMVAAFAIIGGFMFWLNGQAEAERAARAVVEEEMPEEPVNDGVPEVALGDVAAGFDADEYVGQEVRGANFEVASMLGTQGFWLNTPSGNPFLVTWSDALMAEGMSVNLGDRVTVTGEMTAMDVAVIGEWAAAETITENDRIVAEFATHYIVAESVEVTSPAAAPSGGAD